MANMVNKAKTHCPRGHPYDDMNTYVTKDGIRQCRSCKREQARERYVRVPRKRRPFCVRGHSFDESNTGVLASGKHYCKICEAARRMKTDPSTRRMYSLRWRNRFPDKVVALNRRSQLRKYNLTVDQFDAMVLSQNGVCAICRKAPKSGFTLCVDHCHETGVVRGLLCNRCNSAIGLLDEDPARIRRASNYIIESQYMKEAANG